jgi:CheY-like chemotaxis protein
VQPVLIVEDDANDVTLLRDSLDRINLLNAVDVATSAETARLYLTHNVPALLISDVYLPRETGIDLLHWLREQPAPLGNIPVIMLSGSMERVHQLNASALRALLFMQKPIETDVLLDALRGLGLLVTRVVKGQGFGVVIDLPTLQQVRHPQGHSPES